MIHLHKKKVKEVEIYSQLAKEGFVFHEDVVNVLNLAYSSGQNIILYGPGGYGKSEMSLAFAKAIGYETKDIGVFPMSNETSPEEIFGNVDLEAMARDKKYKINIEKSVWSKEVVILEEAFDANPSTMAALKQMLTSRKFEYNEQSYDIKTKLVIICTNKSPNEFNVGNTDSIGALIQRFPVQQRVQWLDHSSAAYGKLLSSRFPNLPTKFRSALSDIFANNQYEGKNVPPRVAIQATKIFLVNKHLDDLMKIMPDIPQGSLTKYDLNNTAAKSLNQQLEEKYINDLAEKIKPIIDELSKELNAILGVEDLNEKTGLLDAYIALVETLVEDSDNLVDIVDEHCKALYQKIMVDRLNTLLRKASVEKEMIHAEKAAEKSASVISYLVTHRGKRTELTKILSSK